MWVLLSIPVGLSILSAPWWTGVGVIAAVILALAGFALNSSKSSKRLKQATIPGKAEIVGSNVAAIGNNITQHVVTHQHNSPLQSSSRVTSEDRKPSGPSFWDITDAIKGVMSDYDRHHVALKYNDVAVSWIVKLDSMKKLDGYSLNGDWWGVNFEPVPTQKDQTVGSGRIAGVINLTDHPNAKLVNRGHMCWVVGRIGKVEYGDIWLQKGFQVVFVGM